MKKVDRYFYPAVFTYEQGQEIAVSFPDLECATSGTNEDDALLSARELLGCVLNGLEEDGENIPAPTPLPLVKLEENERVVLVDVYMPSIRMASKPICQPHSDSSCMAQCRSSGARSQFLPGSPGCLERATTSPIKERYDHRSYLFFS